MRQLAHLRGEERDRDRLPRGRHQHDGALAPAAAHRVVERRSRCRRPRSRRRSRATPRRVSPSASAACCWASWRADDRDVGAEMLRDRAAQQPDRSRADDADAHPGVDAGPVARVQRRPRSARRVMRRRSTPPSGSGASADASTKISSVMPPSTKTPSIDRIVRLAAACGRAARHCAQVPHGTNGCTATARPSSSTPAISWPIVVVGESGADHLEVGAADPRAAHANAHARSVGRGNVDDANAVDRCCARLARARVWHRPSLVCARSRRRRNDGNIGSQRRARSSGIPYSARRTRGFSPVRREYYDDLKIDGLLHVAFVRSTVAHANVTGDRHERRGRHARRRRGVHRRRSRSCPTCTAS